MFSHIFWIFISYCIVNIVSFDSNTVLSDFGKEYSPIDINASLLSHQIVINPMKCIFQCHEYFQCQIFNYDLNTHQCRLFEGDLLSTGSIISSSSTTSIVGQILLLESNFKSYNQSCNHCRDNRFLRCMNTKCTCHGHTYWNGSFCLPQIVIPNIACQQDMNMCRTDLDLTCQFFNKCVYCAKNNTIITFDDLSSSTSVPNGYHNISWTNAQTASTSTNTSGYYTSIVSGSNLIYNYNGNPMTMTSVVGSYFTLKSLSVAAAWLDNLQLEIVGYRSNVVVKSNTYTIRVFTLSNIRFDGYVGLDKIIFTTSGGTAISGLGGMGTHFAMDNICLVFT